MVPVVATATDGEVFGRLLVASEAQYAAYGGGAPSLPQRRCARTESEIGLSYYTI